MLTVIVHIPGLVGFLALSCFAFAATFGSGEAGLRGINGILKD